MESVKKKFGRRARLRRESLDLTQAQVAEFCESAISTIQRIEAGKLWPVAELFGALHDALRLPIGALIVDEPIVVKPTSVQALHVLTDLVRAFQRFSPDVLDSLATASNAQMESVAAVLSAGKLPNHFKPGVATKARKKAL